MNITEQVFNADAHDFLEQLFLDLETQRIQIQKHWDIDHICYRADSLENYQSLKNSFSRFSILLTESEVNGRPIATYKLEKPIQYKEWRIDLVELPSPKKNKPTVLGFEHIEVVCDVPFSELQSLYSHLPLDTSGLAKDFNQELEISLGLRNIKFHLLSLESVITLEKNEKAWTALQKSKVLSVLKLYRPLVAGTFPLGIHQEKSDLDILMTSEDLISLQMLIRKNWGHLSDFRTQIYDVCEKPTLVTNFIFDDVPIEIFAQSKESIRQTAYRHFQVEERLLKLGGPNFKERVLMARQQGLKTELAFAQTLEIKGDAYQELLSLQTQSNTGLKKILAL